MPTPYGLWRYPAFNPPILQKVNEINNVPTETMNPSKLSESLSRLGEKYSLSVIYAFGSRSKEALDFVLGRNLIPDFRGSDLDIGVLPQRTVNLSVHQKVDLAADLEDLFDTHPVDLVVLPEADPFLAANIIRGERLYCRDETQADEYELYVLRRAGDLAPLERERIALIRGEGKIEK